MINAQPSIIHSNNEETCGVIEQFSEGYFLLKGKHAQVSVFSEASVNYHDYVCVLGEVKPTKKSSNFFTDPIQTWQTSHNHGGTINAKQVNMVRASNSFKSKVYTKLNNASDTKWMMILLFQQNIESASLFVSLLFSTGLQYSYLLRMINKTLSRWFIQEHINLVLLGGWLLFGWGWGVSFVWWRVLFMVVCLRFLKNKALGISIGYGLLLVLFPQRYASVSLVLPMMLQMVNAHQRPGVLARGIMLAILQHMLMFSSNLLLLVGFRLFRHASGMAYALAWLLIAVPVFRPGFNNIMDHLMLWTLPSSLSLSGKLPGLVGIVMLALLLSNMRYKRRANVGLIALSVFFVGVWKYPPYDLVLFFNVGQADAALIRTRYNRDAFMVDVGRKSNSALLSRSLFGLGVSKLDGVLLSHADDDHAGGLERLMHSVDVGEVYSNHENVHWTTIDFLALNSTYEGVDENDNSFIGVVQVGELRYLFLGDVYQSGESHLIKQYPNLLVDVIKVAHHGSKTSTSTKLLSQIQARFGIVSADPSVYHHPHINTLKSLHEYKVIPLLTHDEGDIAFVRIFNVQFIITSKARFGIIKAVIR